MAETLIVIVALRMLLGESSDYDERQNAAQGMAAKYALWTFLGYSYVWIMYEMMEGEKLLGTGMILLIGCVAALLVYLTIVIVRDAYVPANFDGWHWLLVVFAAVGYGSFGYRIYLGELDWTAGNPTGWTGLACGIVMTWSALLVIGKRLLSRTEKE